MSGLAEMRTHTAEGRIHIAVIGEIDASNAAELGGELTELIQPSAYVVVDVTEVGFIDSAGLRMLWSLAERSGESGATFRLVAPPESVARGVIDTVEMTESLYVCDRPPVDG